MLLVRVEKSLKGVGGEPDRFGDQAREEEGDFSHLRDVALEDGAEVGEVRGRGPEVGREEVVVEGVGWGGEGVRRREVDLLALIYGEGGDFGGEGGVAEE